MTDPAWIRALLGVHVAAGVTCFILAPVALATAKGGKTHRRWGKVYFWAMAVVASTALVLAIWRPILFLALIAIFSFYSAFRGYRVLGQKDRVRGGKVKPLDWIAAALTALASLALLLLGAFKPSLVSNLGIPAIFFGLLGLWIVSGEVRGYLRRPTEKMFWWYSHLQGMIGSYIAAWTAFSVVTIGPHIHHAWWIWVAPASIGVPAIFATTAYYRKKFAPRSAAAVSSRAI
jgi:uncharacterized membrane protein